MARPEHHVTYNSTRGGWDVKRNNAERSSGHFDTKAEAIEAGRRMSRNAGTELIIHNRNNAIGGADSHGNDPCPPRDRR